MWVETRRGRYVVRWRDPATKGTTSKSFASREEAQAFASRAETSTPPRKLTLATYIEQMLREDWNLLGSSRYGYERTLERHIRTGIGRRPMGEITTAELREFFVRLDIGMAGKAGVYRLLAKAYNQAVKDGVLERSPLKAIPRPRSTRKPIAPLNPSQIGVLASLADPRYRAAILLAAYAGLRAGEVGGLRVQDMDLERLCLRIVQAVRTEGGVRVLGDVKTPAGRRQVAIPAFLAVELQRHIRDYAPAPDGRIFTTGGGGYVCHTVLLKRLQAAARAAGVLPAPRFHLLRHSAAAMMIAQGAHPKVIQAQLGHANISVTLDVYGHLFPSLAHETAAKLDSLFRAVADGSADLADS
jgi:integrase